MTKNPSNERKIVGNLFGFRLTTGLILTILAIIITYFLPYDPVRNEGFTPVAKWTIISISILVLYQAFLNTTNVIFQKHLRYEQSTLANIIGSVVTLLSATIFVFLKAPLPVILISYTIGSFFSGITLFIFVKKLFPHFSPLFSVKNFKKLIISSMPLGLTLVFNLVYFRADVFILTLFRTTTEVGAYGLAYKFFEFPLTFPTFFANSLYPILLARSENREEFKKTIVKSAVFLLLMSVIIMIGFYLASPLLTIIRSDFYPSIAVLRLLSLSMPVFFISSLFMWILITFGKNKQLLLIYFSGMIINLALNLIFVPNYGITAAALITFFSEFLIMLASGWVCFKLIMTR